MTRLDWYPEPFSPTGNLTSEGARRQLGRSHLGPLDLLVRESMQNSWDACVPGNSLSYRIDLQKLDAARREVMKTEVFHDGPANIGLSCLWEGEISNVLIISDRGTSGLTGPARADRVKPDTQERDFVDFIFNLGQPRDTDFGGGTYGYGKSVLYNISAISTIIVHSRTAYEGRRISRLIGVGLGPQYENFTGRHWWGRRGDDGVIEPVIGSDADRLADSLGFPSFGDQETGTSIMITLPDLGISSLCPDDEDVERTADEFMADLGASLLWNFWPKLLASNPSDRRVKITIAKDTTELTLPSPDRHPAFFGFRKAMEAVRRARSDADYRPDEAGQRVIDIGSGRPKKHLGLVSLCRFPGLPAAPPGSAEARSFETLIERLIWQRAPFADLCSHVALMRDAELVVRYEAGRPSGEGHYAGVFVTDRDSDVDHAYAEAEPPAHDDWEPSGLKPPASTFVRVGLERVREAIKSFATPLSELSRDGNDIHLGGISERLAGLVAPTSGSGYEIQTVRRPSRTINPGKPDDHPTERGGGGGEGGNVPEKDTRNVREPLPRLMIQTSGQLEMFGGRRALRVPFEVDTRGSVKTFGLRVLYDVRTADETTTESDSPLGVEKAEVLGWFDPAGEKCGIGPEISLSDELSGQWSVVVSIPGDVLLGVSLEAFRIGPA
jgi:hypothetical protein